MSKELKEKIRHRLREHSHIFNVEKINQEQLRLAIIRIIEELKLKEYLQIDEPGTKKLIDELIDEAIPMSLSFFMSSSSPTTNKRNAIPISARMFIVGRSLISPSTLGPMIIPASLEAVEQAVTEFHAVEERWREAAGERKGRPAAGRSWQR